MTKKRARSRAQASAPRAATNRRTPVNVDYVARRGGPDWRWRTFPVFFAFVTGLLIAFIVNGGSVNPAAFVLQIAALLGFGYCLAHLIVTNIVLSGRERRRRDTEERGEDPDKDMEDVVVYPEDAEARG